MNNEIPEEITKAVDDAVRVIVMSIITQEALTDLKEFKKKQNNNSARENYCRTALLLFGMLAYPLDKLNDTMFNRVLFFAIGSLNLSLKNKKINSYYKGLQLDFVNDDKSSYSNLSWEIFNWFRRNDSKQDVETITTTGKHLFLLMALKDKLSDENIEKFYEMGSLIQKNTNGMSVMKDVLMNKKIKLNF